MQLSKQLVGISFPLYAYNNKEVTSMTHKATLVTCFCVIYEQESYLFLSKLKHMLVISTGLLHDRQCCFLKKSLALEPTNL